ncbi:restriction endonuclease [Dialister hominis]|uniref:restriction endonuclease n=1 Tax=Dialister hominis TaxID=2582419 RepID=UPI003AB4D12B
MYEAKSNEIFANTDIKGGIVITYRDRNQDFGKIGVFKPFKELDWILKKVTDRKDFKEFSQIVYSRTSYRITEKLHQDYPEAITHLSKGHRYDMSTNIMDLLSFVFYKEKPQDKYEYIQIYGRTANQRTYQYIRRDYVNLVDNLDKWKVFVPKSNGSGALGEVLTTPVIGHPVIGHTESFISIGCFDSESEANACLKYIKTKFARCLLGILKVTQDNPPDRWRFIPLQDFTNQSDIDWSGSIHDIDLQLYKKYKLDQKEINFIESHVQAM